MNIKNNTRKISGVLKGKTIKILGLMLVVGVVSFFNVVSVFAAGAFSVSGGGTVSAGASQTITITASNCAGKFTVSASGGGTVSSSSVFLDNGSTTVTVKAPSSGSTTVSVTASDVTDYDANPVSGTKSTTVTVQAAAASSSSSNNSSSSGSSNSSSSSNSSNTTTTTQTTTPVVVKSSNNNLSKLSLDKGDLSPTFSSSTTSYKLELLDIEKIKVSATASDSKATISGVGEKSLTIGTNKIEVVVTAENGNKKTYTINIELDMTPSVYIDYNDVSYGVVVNTANADIPGGFEETTVQLGEEELVAWNNPNCGLDIVYLVNDSDETGLFVVEEGAIKSSFQTVAVLGRNLYLLANPEWETSRKGMVYQEVEIDGNMYMGWVFEDQVFENYAIVEFTKKNGNTVDFLYHSSSNAMVEFITDEFLSTAELDEANLKIEELEKNNTTLKTNLASEQKENDTLTIILILVSVIGSLCTVISVLYAKKFKKLYLLELDLSQEYMDESTESIDEIYEENVADYTPSNNPHDYDNNM